MKKNALYTAAVTLGVMLLLMAVLAGCGRKNDAEITGPAEAPEAAAETAGVISDEEALSAIRNYCCSVNPDLQEIVNAGQYPAYWEVASSDEKEIVILFRSYTGAQTRYYIDRSTGETYVTEFVPGIFTEEQRTEETFNVIEYIRP